MSFQGVIQKLRQGESTAFARRIGVASEDMADLSDHLRSIQGKANTAASRARRTTGSDYLVESGTLVTSGNNAVMAVAVVTCVEGGNLDPDDADDI